MDSAVGDTGKGSETQPPVVLRVAREIDAGDPGKGATPAQPRAAPGPATPAQPRAAPGPATEAWCWRVLCANWCTRWAMDEQLRAMMPPRDSDFRDSLPPPLEDVYAAYRPYVQDGKWTMGLLRVRGEA